MQINTCLKKAITCLRVRQKHRQKPRNQTENTTKIFEVSNRLSRDRQKSIVLQINHGNEKVKQEPFYTIRADIIIFTLNVYAKCQILVQMAIMPNNFNLNSCAQNALTYLSQCWMTLELTSRGGNPIWYDAVQYNGHLGQPQKGEELYARWPLCQTTPSKIAEPKCLNMVAPVLDDT